MGWGGFGAGGQFNGNIAHPKQGKQVPFTMLLFWQGKVLIFIYRACQSQAEIVCALLCRHNPWRIDAIIPPSPSPVCFN